MKQILDLLNNVEVNSIEQDNLTTILGSHITTALAKISDQAKVKDTIIKYIPILKNRIYILTRKLESIGKNLSNISAYKVTTTDTIDTGLNLGIITHLNAKGGAYKEANTDTMVEWSQKTNLAIDDLTTVLTAASDNFYNSLSDATIYRIQQLDLKLFYTNYEIYLRDRREQIAVTIESLNKILDILVIILGKIN